MNDSILKNTVKSGKKPNHPDYTLEAGINALAWFQDIFVKSALRHYDAHLPIPKNIQDNYYYHSGDFKDGFTASLFTNLFLTVGTEQVYKLCERNLSENNNITKIMKKISNSHNLINLVSGLVGSGIVVLEETKGGFSYPDLNDIPAGILGAIAQMGLRYLSTRNYEKNKIVNPI